jgi:hypothetical protein
VYAIRVAVGGVLVFSDTLTVAPSAVDPTKTAVTFDEQVAGVGGYVHGEAGYIKLAFSDAYGNRVKGVNPATGGAYKVPMSTLRALIREGGFNGKVVSEAVIDQAAAVSVQTSTGVHSVRFVPAAPGTVVLQLAVGGTFVTAKAAGQSPGSSATGDATLPITTARSARYSAAASLVAGPGIGAVGSGPVLNRPSEVRVLLRDTLGGDLTAAPSTDGSKADASAPITITTGAAGAPSAAAACAVTITVNAGSEGAPAAPVVIVMGALASALEPSVEVAAFATQAGWEASPRPFASPALYAAAFTYTHAPEFSGSPLSAGLNVTVSVGTTACRRVGPVPGLNATSPPRRRGQRHGEHETPG